MMSKAKRLITRAKLGGKVRINEFPLEIYVAVI